MRLGEYPCELLPGSLAAGAYASSSVNERHRHRFEFNNDFRDLFDRRGVCFSGPKPGWRIGPKSLNCRIILSCWAVNFIPSF